MSSDNCVAPQMYTFSRTFLFLLLNEYIERFGSFELYHYTTTHYFNSTEVAALTLMLIFQSTLPKKNK